MFCGDCIQDWVLVKIKIRFFYFFFSNFSFVTLNAAYIPTSHSPVDNDVCHISPSDLFSFFLNISVASPYENTIPRGSGLIMRRPDSLFSVRGDKAWKAFDDSIFNGQTFLFFCVL